MNKFNLKRYAETNEGLNSKIDLYEGRLYGKTYKDGSVGVHCGQVLLFICVDLKSAVRAIQALDNLRAEISGVLSAQSVCDDIDVEKTRRKYDADNYSMAKFLHGRKQSDEDSPFIPIP